MVLIDAIKPKVEKKLKTYFIFWKGELEAYKKIKPVCFFSLYVCWWQQKQYSKDTRKFAPVSPLKRPHNPPPALQHYSSGGDLKSY